MKDYNLDGNVADPEPVEPCCPQFIAEKKVFKQLFS